MNRYRIIAIDPKGPKPQIRLADALDEAAARRQIEQSGLRVSAVVGCESLNPDQLGVTPGRHRVIAGAAVGAAMLMGVVWAGVSGIRSISNADASPIPQPAQSFQVQPTPSAVPALAETPSPAQSQPDAITSRVRAEACRTLDTLSDRQCRATVARAPATLVTPANCADPRQVAATRAKVQELSQAEEQFWNDYLSSCRQARSDIEAHVQDSAAREQALRELDDTLRPRLAFQSAMHRLNQAVYAEREWMLYALLCAEGHYRVENGTFSFESQEMVEAFNDSRSRIAGIVRKGVEASTPATAESRHAAPARGTKIADADDEPGSEHLALEVTSQGVLLNQRTLTLPADRNDLIAALGEPSRTIRGNAVTGLMWDALGLSALQSDESGRIESLGVLLNHAHSGLSEPAETFPGKFTVAAADVSELDTPRTLNRALSGMSFEYLRSRGFWQLDLPACKVVMKIEKHGLCDSVVLLPAHALSQPPKSSPTLRF